MQTLPKLFSEKGVFIEHDFSDVPLAHPVRVRYEAVATAYAANAAAEQALADAFAEVEEALFQFESADARHNAHFPKQTYMDLWRDTFTGEAYARSGRR